MGKKIEISAGSVVKVFNHVGVYSASTPFSIHVVESATDDEVHLFPTMFISPSSSKSQCFLRPVRFLQRTSEPK